MSTVSVVIAGRSYRMACDEGEEEHLQSLGQHVDQTIERLRRDFGEIGDGRLVIMAAITVADELAEARRRIGELEQKLGAANRDSGEALRDKLAGDLAVLLDSATDRIDAIARQLDGAVPPIRN